MADKTKTQKPPKSEPKDAPKAPPAKGASKDTPKNAPKEAAAKDNKPVQPNEEEFKAKLATAEKEHASLQQKLVCH